MPPVMAPVAAAALVLQLSLLLLFSLPSTAQPGFLSLDCGGEAGAYTDKLGINWSSDSKFISGGQTVTLPVQDEQLQKQYSTLRYFPADGRKYCYTIHAKEQMRYLVRASFLYGNFDKRLVYPKFQISLGDTRWSSIVITDASSVVVKEAIILNPAREILVCLSEATTDQPFISTLEFRILSGSLYSTPYESQYFLSLSARINFGAETNDSIRYPDDPFDRIWESDLVRTDLSYNAPGTKRISTTKPIFVGIQEEPPAKVMQTAVVGESGYSNYRIDLEDSIQNAWAFAYFAEIQDLAPNDTRRFQWEILGQQFYVGALTDPTEDAQGMYRSYELGLKSMSFPRFLYLASVKTNDSSKGPMINAFEVYNYIPIATGSQDDHRKRRRRIIIIATCSASGAILLIAVAIGCCYLFARKKKPSSHELGLGGAATTKFKLSEIEHATKNFEQTLGSGGTATVYYGKLADGREIAAKLLKSNNSHGIENFFNEIALVSRIHHRQLVSFLGYCQQAGKNILVYEFMQNGTLEQHIRGGPDDVKITNWVHRLQIAEDAAKGIEYLHTGCTPTIVHRDIKTCNILLDNNMRARLADFGLLKPLVDGAQGSPKRACGTFPYIDPVYLQTGQLSEKSDVYSLCVVLLELISGEPPLPADNSRVIGHLNIATWARSHLESIQGGNINAIIDESLEIGYNPESVQKIAELAITSVGEQVAQRPSISEVIREIQEAIRMEVPLEAPNNQQLPAVDEEIFEDDQADMNKQDFIEMMYLGRQIR